MPITTFTDYKEKIAQPFREYSLYKNNATVDAGFLYSTWLTNPLPGLVPADSEACDSSLAGCLGQKNADTVLRLLQLAVAMNQEGTLIIADRLSHVAGLNATNTAPQSSVNTNLPTAPLTRYTDGVGVVAALEIYTNVGTGTAQVSLSYTNSSGVASRVGMVPQIGGTGFRVSGRLIPVSLNPPDIGVRSVESVTLATSTGTVGDFGVTLFKPLVAIGINNPRVPLYFDSITGLGGQIPKIEDDACLWMLFISSTTASGVIQASFKFGEE